MCVWTGLCARNQCLAARTRQQSFKVISRSVRDRGAEVILKLYLSLVEPRLGSATQLGPHVQKVYIFLRSGRKKMTT